MHSLKKNMGKRDRALRVLVGSALLLIGPFTDLIPTDTFSNIILGCMATMAIISAVLSYCVLYNVTGFDTRGNTDKL